MNAISVNPQLILSICTPKSPKPTNPLLPFITNNTKNKKSSLIQAFTFMADLNSRESVSARSEFDGDGKVEDVSVPNFTEIIVIRHGETEWNADGRIQGHLDVDLNDVGRQQAAAVADRLAREPKISAVYSSDLKRAFDTAEIIAKQCGIPEVAKDPNLRERNLGDLQGLVFHAIAEINPEAYKAFVSHRRDQEIPGGGESLDQLYARCTSALESIAKKHRGERVVVVSHGGTIRALYRRASPHGRSVGRVMNTSISVFNLSDGEWSIKSWADVSHLNKTGFLESGFGGDRNSG